MKIYTSYFAMARRFPSDLVQISISRFAPPGFKGPEYKTLAPSKELLAAYKENKDESAYVEIFNQYLSTLSPDAVVAELGRISHGQDCVLLCYEKIGNFCHRHLVSHWLSNAGYSSEELNL